MPTPSDLANGLLELVKAVLSDFESEHAPGLDLPRVHGGYLVGPDARADLAFTLSLLHEAGVEQVAGLQCADVALDIVRQLDGRMTHSFYSYRTAETLLRFGGLDDNPALGAWNEADLANAAEAAGHWYNRSLYDPLGERVADQEATWLLDDPAALCEFDVFHLHWPEWSAGTDPARTREVIANLRAAGIPILWTQHNRKPHLFPQARESYQIWCSEADGVVHHSRYGRAVMESDYGYGDHTRHLVAPHGHWGPRLEPLRPAGGKAEAEKSLGLAPTQNKPIPIGQSSRRRPTTSSRVWSPTTELTTELRRKPCWIWD